MIFFGLRKIPPKPVKLIILKEENRESISIDVRSFQTEFRKHYGNYFKSFYIFIYSLSDRTRLYSHKIYTNQQITMLNLTYNQITERSVAINEMRNNPLHQYNP